MKTTRFAILMLTLGLMAAGCSKSNSQATNSDTGQQPGVPPVLIDPTAPNFNAGSNIAATGSTVTLTPVDLQTMTDYVATHPLNNPTNIKINVNLFQTEVGRYGGSVSISYTDNGTYWPGVLRAGLGRNRSISGLYDNGSLEASFNYWFNFENKLIFSGFFEDSIGAIAMTLVPETSAPSGNDAEPIKTTYKGYIYYKNFLVQNNPFVGGSTTATMAEHSPHRACWFIYRGPYDCRSNIIQTKVGLFPGAGAGYKLLGTFTGLNIKSAFNIQ